LPASKAAGIRGRDALSHRGVEDVVLANHFLAGEDLMIFKVPGSYGLKGESRALSDEHKEECLVSQAGGGSRAHILKH
jgi:hypothetical protein